MLDRRIGDRVVLVVGVGAADPYQWDVRPLRLGCEIRVLAAISEVLLT
jgi:hypothetical protein